MTSSDLTESLKNIHFWNSQCQKKKIPKPDTEMVSSFLSLNESCWVLLQTNHFFTAFCGQSVPFGCVATFVLGYESRSVAEPNTLTLTVMLCSSHSFHPSFPNTIPARLRRLVYGRIQRTILTTQQWIKCQWLAQQMASVFNIFEHIVSILSSNNNLFTE